MFTFRPNSVVSLRYVMPDGTSEEMSVVGDKGLIGVVLYSGGEPTRYTHVLITQVAQIAVCKRHHAVDPQLCRWLLLSLDRLSAHQLTMTKEFIATMLGVRRDDVTDAAGKLQKLGIINYVDGQITSRQEEELATCESGPISVPCGIA